MSPCDSCAPSGPKALPVASLSRQAGPALLILFYLRAPLNINAFLSLNYSLTGLPTHSAFVYLPLFHSSTFPPASAFTALGSVFPPRRLISDDIRCDGLLALIRLSHDFMTLILPLEQNPLLYFDRWMAFFGSIYIHKGTRLKANLKSNTDIVVSYPASERFISRKGWPALKSAWLRRFKMCRVTCALPAFLTANKGIQSEWDKQARWRGRDYSSDFSGGGDFWLWHVCCFHREIWSRPTRWHAAHLPRTHFFIWNALRNDTNDEVQ